MGTEVTKLQMAWAAFKRMLGYSVFELSVVVALTIGYLNGGVWSWLLWVLFIIAGMWTATVSSKESEWTAKDMILTKDLYMTDFLTSGILLCIAAVLTLGESWYFPVMFLLAATQNMRYTYLSAKWQVEIRDAKSNNDKMP